MCVGGEQGWGEGFREEVGPAGLHPQWDGVGGGRMLLEEEAAAQRGFYPESSGSQLIYFDLEK